MLMYVKKFVASRERKVSTAHIFGSQPKLKTIPEMHTLVLL